MRFRLSGREVRSLYASGVSRRLPANVVDAFFGALEAIQAAPSEADLRALLSLSFETRSAAVRLSLQSGFWLLGRRVSEGNATVLVFEEIQSPAEGYRGA